MYDKKCFKVLYVNNEKITILSCTSREKNPYNNSVHTILLSLKSNH